MNMPAPHTLLARVRRRAIARVLLLALPWLAVAGVWMWQTPSQPLAWLALAAVAMATLGMALWQRERHDTRWLARMLDRHPSLEDSASLLFTAPAEVTGLAALQRDRVAARYAALRSEQVSPAGIHPGGLLGNALLAGAVLAALLLRAGIAPQLAARLPDALQQRLIEHPPSLRRLRVQAQPPAYTGLAAQTRDGGDMQAPQGSVLQWQILIDGSARSAALEFDDGSRLPLQPRDGRWVAQRRLERSGLYRVVTQPALPPAQRSLHRLQATPDRPPVVRAVQPARSLTLRTVGQRSWPLLFEATDDYGVATEAQLRIIQTSGEGENIRSSERSLRLNGSGPPRQRRFSYVFDLARSGLTVGNDVIVQLIVHDNRQPQPQVTRSASVILRWPPERPGEAGGFDGLLKRALPAYFRSQRQIIIDAEKLLAQRGTLDAEEFGQRSNALGVDQRTLRLRYGQFLGEEAEDGPSLPTSDVADDDAHDDDAKAGADAHAGHDHDATPTGATQDFNQGAEAAMAEISHTHDIPEAATLLDPQTREVLRAALREMWSSEGELRSGTPQTALPFARRALVLIKQVQEADRIYLPRMGSEQPPIDPARRLTGKREGLAPRSTGFVARVPSADPLDALWQASAPAQAGAALPSALIDAARVHLRGRADTDLALAALAALDEAARDQACVACRQRLRATLWPLLQPATRAPAPRTTPDTAGRAYLDALRQESRR